jgi:hypothetical protein
MLEQASVSTIGLLQPDINKVKMFLKHFRLLSYSVYQCRKA